MLAGYNSIAKKVQKLTKIFSKSWGGGGCYFKNHCNNTRLVCTHLNAFFMLNPNMAMKIQFLKNLEKFVLSSAKSSIDNCLQKVKLK